MNKYNMLTKYKTGDIIKVEYAQGLTGRSIRIYKILNGAHWPTTVECKILNCTKNDIYEIGDVYCWNFDHHSIIITKLGILARLIYE